MAKHAFKMLHEKPSIDLPTGRRFDAVKSNFGVLKGMAAYVLEISPGCFREPHWHPNSVELSYCLQGRARVTLCMDENKIENFLVEEGDLFFVPKGALHCIENLDQGTTRFLIVFGDESPEDFGYSGFYGSMPAPIIEKVFEIKDAPKGSKRDVFFSKGVGNITHAKNTSPYKLAFEKSDSIVHTEYGVVKVGRASNFPALQAISMYSLELDQKGVREPHWHPNCAEMGFVKRGAGKLLIRSPDGTEESFIVEEGDLYFIPPAYPHYIEPVDERGFHFLISFNDTSPQDIGIAGSSSALDPAILAATLSADQKQVQDFKRFNSDLFITGKKIK